MSAWDDEPSQDAFVASGLYCLIRRTPEGAWAGYAGVQKEHALWRQPRDVLIALPESFAARVPDLRRIAAVDIATVPAELVAGMTVPLSIAIDVHGGLYFTGMLPSLDEPYWYFGFSCTQPWDYKPLDPLARSARETMDPEQHEALFRTAADYRTVEYARSETERLAAQIAALSGVTVAGQPERRATAFSVPPARSDGLRV